MVADSAPCTHALSAQLRLRAAIVWLRIAQQTDDLSFSPAGERVHGTVGSTGQQLQCCALCVSSAPPDLRTRCAALRACQRVAAQLVDVPRARCCTCASTGRFRDVQQLEGRRLTVSSYAVASMWGSSGDQVRLILIDRAAWSAMESRAARRPVGSRTAAEPALGSLVRSGAAAGSV